MCLNENDRMDLARVEPRNREIFLANLKDNLFFSLTDTCEHFPHSFDVKGENNSQHRLQKTNNCKNEGKRKQRGWKETNKMNVYSPSLFLV